MTKVASLVERRNAQQRRRLVERIRSEYREMPGMALTAEQAARLLTVERSACQRILNELVRDGELHRTHTGVYRVDSSLLARRSWRGL